MGAIRAACARQQIQDDDRRAMQEQITGKASMADMTIGEMGKLLDHLNKGWKAPQAHRPHIGKIRALWWSLYWTGALDEPNDAAIDAFVKRQTGIAALRFLDHQKAPSVIEALKSWLTRQGVNWPREGDIGPIALDQGLTMAKLERHAVLNVIERRLRERKVMYGDWIHYLQAALPGSGLNHWVWTERELDTGIRLLGKKLRTAMARASVD